MGDLAGPRPIALAYLVEEGRAPRLGQQLPPIADEPAYRQHVFETDAAVRVGRHLLETALPPGERGLDLADELGRDIDGDPLVWLLEPVGRFVEDDLRSRGGEL